MARIKTMLMHELLVCVWLLSIASGVLAGEPRVELLGTPSAKGMVVCRIVVPAGWNDAALSLQLRTPSGEIVSGLTHSDWSSDALGALAGRSADGSVLIPLVAPQMGHSRQFAFPEGGRYTLTLRAAANDRTGANPTSLSAVVTDARASDVAFLNRIAKDELFAKLERARGWSNRPEDMPTRALAVVDVLLSATTAPEPLQGEFATIECYQTWTDAMLDLSRDLPDSGYAPYAAFFAGAGYVGLVCELPEYVGMDVEQRRSQALVARARGALEAAVSGADDYLRPRVVCQQARLSACLGSWDDADRLLDKASSLAGPDVGAHRLIEEMRRYIARSHRSPG
jgi:hypothetical protein